MRTHTQPGQFAGTLLDRLCSRPAEDVAQVTLQQGEQRADNLLDSIHRNLSWILNTTQLSSSRSLQKWPFVSHSSLNFGVPDLSGRDLYEHEPYLLEQEIAQSIRDFEPRIEAESLRVKAVCNAQGMGPSAITVQVSARCLPHLGGSSLSLQAQLDHRYGGVVDIQFT